jgi:hypothetical protein
MMLPSSWAAVLEVFRPESRRRGTFTQSMVICWYALYGHDPADVTDRAIAQPWYQTKTEPSFEDMIGKLRKTLIAARYMPVTPGKVDPALLHDYALACAAAAA